MILCGTFLSDGVDPKKVSRNIRSKSRVSRFTHVDSAPPCGQYCCGEAMDSKPTGRTVELLLNSAFGDPLTTARYEGLCAGDPNMEVTRGAVCYAPTVEHLRR